MAVILYVDTDQLYMSTMKLLLEQHGFKVLLARTRDHMRQVLLVNVVDLVLIDQDFARECPKLISEISTMSPNTKTVLLGMRPSERPSEMADGYCARLDGPQKLLAVIGGAISARLQQTAQRA